MRACALGAAWIVHFRIEALPEVNASYARGCYRYTSRIKRASRMYGNFFLPGELEEYGDVALLKTLREYQRAQTHLARQTSPAFYSLNEQIAAAIVLIETELALRGRDVTRHDC
jgi:hypothetical protein